MSRSTVATEHGTNDYIISVTCSAVLCVTTWRTTTLSLHHRESLKSLTEGLRPIEARTVNFNESSSTFPWHFERVLYTESNWIAFIGPQLAWERPYSQSYLKMSFHLEQ
jgi:hypothetical protein